MTSSTVHTSAPRLGSDERSSWAENPLFHVSRLCVGFLQGLFESAELGCFHWVDNLEQTEIVISDDVPIDMDVINPRPAITTVRSPSAFGRTSMDQMMTTNLRTGERVHTDMISGHITFNCISRVKIEAELIGWLTGRHLWILRRMLLRAGFNDIGQGIQIAPPSPAGALVQGDTEMVNVAVTSPFRFQWTESIRPLNQTVVQNIETRMGIATGAVHRVTQVAEGGGTSGPGMRGTAVGASYSNDMNAMKSPSSKVRQPHLRGRPISTTPRAGSQSEPDTVTVKT